MMRKVKKMKPLSMKYDPEKRNMDKFYRPQIIKNMKHVLEAEEYDQEIKDYFEGYDDDQ